MAPAEKKRVSPARRVAYAGLVAALSAVLLYLMYVLPTLKLSMLFVLSLLPVTLAHERRFADAALAFAASALLSGLLFPARGAWVLYAAFFGWYGIAREWVVTKLKRAASWAVLLALFNAAFFALYLFAGHVLAETVENTFMQSLMVPAVVIPAAEAIFVLYELVFGVCREYYVRHVRKLLYR